MIHDAKTPAVLMIAWCRAVELASYPLECAERVFHDLRSITLTFSKLSSLKQQV